MDCIFAGLWCRDLLDAALAFTAFDGLLIDVHDFFILALVGMMFLDPTAGGLAHLGGAFGMGECFDERESEAVAVVGLDEPTGLAGGNRVADCPKRGADHRPCAGHCFEHRPAGAVRAGLEQYRNVKSGVGLGQVILAIAESPHMLA